MSSSHLVCAGGSPFQAFAVLFEPVLCTFPPLASGLACNSVPRACWCAVDSQVYRAQLGAKARAHKLDRVAFPSSSLSVLSLFRHLEPPLFSATAKHLGLSLAHDAANWMPLCRQRGRQATGLLLTLSFPRGRGRSPPSEF